MVLLEGVVDTRPLRFGDEVVLAELATRALLRSSTGLGSYLYGDELAEDVPFPDANRLPLQVAGDHGEAARALGQHTPRRQLLGRRAVAAPAALEEGTFSPFVILWEHGG